MSSERSEGQYFQMTIYGSILFMALGILAGWVGTTYLYYSLVFIGVLQAYSATVSLLTLFALKYKNSKRFKQTIYPLVLFFLSLIALVPQIWAINTPIVDIPSPGNFTIVIGMSTFIISFIYLFAVNWLVEEEKTFKQGKILSIFLRGVYWLGLFTAITLILKGLGVPGVELYMTYFMLFSISFIAMETAISSVIKLFIGSGDEEDLVTLYITPAFLSGSNPVKNIIDTIEQNSGISLRSTWAIQFVRQVFGPLILLMILIFWCMTGVVQVSHEEKGVLYHWGSVMTHEPLEPGLYFKWPWPIQTVQKVPAYTVQHFTVGYEQDDIGSGDFIWSKGHGGEEYRFLLGDAKELVSVNMIVSYKIGDVLDYVLNYQNPEEILRGQAYEILMQEIVSTNIDDLLSINREVFVDTVKNKLIKSSENQRLGLDVVSISLVSIHPPVAIAYEYQHIISAQIEKQVMLNEALADREHEIPMAERNKDILLTDVQIEAITRRSEITSEIINFEYQKESYSLEPELYMEWNWLERFEETLKDKKIYLIDGDECNHTGEIWLNVDG